MATNGDERRCKCLAHQVFGGESQSQVTCRGCGTVNRKVEMMFDIGLQIRGKAKVVITLNGKNGGSVKGSPTSPSSSAGSSDTGDGTAGTQSLQDCLDKYAFPFVMALRCEVYFCGTFGSESVYLFELLHIDGCDEANVDKSATQRFMSTTKGTHIHITLLTSSALTVDKQKWTNTFDSQ